MTIAGQHTAQELIDLITAKDAEISDIRTAYTAFQAAWAASDPTTQSAWDSDWTSFLMKYGAARAVAEDALMAAAATPIPNDMLPMETIYQGYLYVIQPVTDTVTPGSLGDLYNRLQAAMTAQGNSSTILTTPTPQPTPNSDFDFNTLQWANQAWTSTVSTLKTVANPLNHPFVWLGLGTVIAGGLFLAYKTSPASMALQAGLNRFHSSHSRNSRGETS